MKFSEIRPEMSDFTEVLGDIAVMPKKLYFYGKIPEKRVKSVAIVGPRKPSRYGQEVGYKVAFELAKRGILVISGLALGIDGVAHRAALDAGGVTIGVLGTPIDKLYPASNVRLAEEMVERGGAVISEYEPGAVLNFKRSFLDRNRIVSGLADAVIVVEAATRSGTLSTAAHALAQGKTIFAVPGNITSPMSAGTNGLIRAGAIPLTSYKDVLEVLMPERLEQAELEILGDSEEENAAIKLIQAGVRDGEEMIAKLGWSVSEFNQTITLLEVKGVIRGLGANCWALK